MEELKRTANKNLRKKAFLVVLESKNLSSSLDMWTWVWPHLKQATRTIYVRVHKDTTNRILLCSYPCFSGKELITFYQTSPINYIQLIFKLHQKSAHQQHKNSQKVKRNLSDKMPSWPNVSTWEQVSWPLCDCLQGRRGTCCRQKVWIPFKSVTSTTPSNQDSKQTLLQPSTDVNKSISCVPVELSSNLSPFNKDGICF